MRLNPLTCTDGYKIDHRRQYPDNTTMVYSNLTPRSDKYSPIPPHLFDGSVVNFGLQYFIKNYLIDLWGREFFQKSKWDVISDYQRRLDNYLGGGLTVDHIGELHDLGYLPLSIRALPEGSLSPIKCPVLVLYNTHPQFAWLTNYIETVLSNSLWKTMTVATISRAYRRLMDQYADMTVGHRDFSPYQGHDFACRGMSGMEDAALCGAAHLLSFVGTDTLSAIDLLEQYYGADVEKECVGVSVAASEHSTVTMGGADNELDTLRRLITDVYPDGIFSYVGDSYDFFKVITEYAEALKPIIMGRNGKLVYRPDSGSPEKIICGDPDGTTPVERKGAAQLLWEVFGGTYSAKGYKQLDNHVGLIYGDSITLPRAEAILDGLAQNNFASNNIVLGIGSFTYQHLTRDSFGFAVKSTYGEVNGVGRDIFKCPKTDDGMKKSLRGRIAVIRDANGDLRALDRQNDFSHPKDQLREVFRNGSLVVNESFSTIRERLVVNQ